MALPKRSAAQRVGDSGENIVRGIIDSHPNWVARTQDRDFGVDLEAEMARVDGADQELLGKLIKVQVKTRNRVKQKNGCASISIERSLLDYSSELKLPVILVIVCLRARRVWWVWLQEWVMMNEQFIANNRKSVTISIPVAQTLSAGLDSPLQSIARGEGTNSIVLSLRDLLSRAIGWENQAVARNVVDLLAGIHGPSREWMIQKSIDILIGYGEPRFFWERQQVLPLLLSIVEKVGDVFTQDQVLRLVARQESVSRTGLIAMGRLYDCWPEHAQSLRLPRAFFEAGSPSAAWYAAMRERYPVAENELFAFKVANLNDADLRYENVQLVLTPEVREHIIMKFPNRGESVLTECLHLI